MRALRLSIRAKRKWVLHLFICVRWPWRRIAVWWTWEGFLAIRRRLRV
jgi:hypothetical protein